MTERSLIEAVRQSNHALVSALLERGHDVHERGDHGWPALNFAAGRGDRETVRLLIDRGADVFATGDDLRTPYKIALAAGHLDVAADLKRREEEQGGDLNRVSSREWETRPFCKAYRLAQLRRYPGWSAAAGVADATEDTIVYVHADYSVTRSFWPGEDVLFTGEADDWRAFCHASLGFRVPTDLD